MTVSDESASPRFYAEPAAEVPEFVITRIFDAPRELVFRAWTEEQHLKQWFAPKGFTVPMCSLNAIPGGVFHYCMRAPNGAEMWGKWAFQEIVPPKRIVLVNTFSNKHGNLTRHPYVAGWPLEMLTTTTLIGDEDEDEGKTGVKIAWAPINATPREQKIFDSMHDEMTQGWNGTFDQLAEYLATI